ncbi:basic salivary proline-rich protein 2-like [Panicum miliaceum]|uniref:Basic salivary proline-rich protein 2-like n=1 Tax=Panicum miliaceum TaxID=4540 RepID=A0A3L6R729_PANMI|nr:basic salivary proline-rich protein 2-like [Panicum miliaceum]
MRAALRLRPQRAAARGRRGQRRLPSPGAGAGARALAARSAETLPSPQHEDSLPPPAPELSAHDLLPTPASAHDPLLPPVPESSPHDPRPSPAPEPSPRDPPHLPSPVLDLEAPLSSLDDDDYAATRRTCPRPRLCLRSACPSPRRLRCRRPVWTRLASFRSPRAAAAGERRGSRSVTRRGSRRPRIRRGVAPPGRRAARSLPAGRGAGRTRTPPATTARSPNNVASSTTTRTPGRPGAGAAARNPVPRVSTSARSSPPRLSTSQVVEGMRMARRARLRGTAAGGGGGRSTSTSTRAPFRNSRVAAGKSRRAFEARKGRRSIRVIMGLVSQMCQRWAILLTVRKNPRRLVGIIKHSREAPSLRPSSGAHGGDGSSGGRQSPPRQPVNGGAYRQRKAPRGREYFPDRPYKPYARDGGALDRSNGGSGQSWREPYERRRDSKQRTSDGGPSRGRPYYGD